MSSTSSAVPNEFYRERHLFFLQNLDSRIKKIDYWQADYLKMNGLYWALTALLLLEPAITPDSVKFNEKSPLSREEIIEFVKSCECKDGGFSGNIGHDAHLTFTLSALQILIVLDKLEMIDIAKHVNCITNNEENGIKERQKLDGSFEGDEFGEIDTRFSYCAISALALLNRIDSVDTVKAIEFVERCKNFDGGYGAIPGGESHSGQVFCCVGMLKILNHPIADEDRLEEWLAWRQLPCGGLNGRPEKLEDVCYSWWVLSSLSMLNKLHWIDREKLQQFILDCQDPDSGGFSDRPGDVTDVFHTVFALAGLSLVGFPGLGSVDARFCLPSSCLLSSYRN